MENFPNLHDRLDAGVNRRPEFGPIYLDLRTRTLRAAHSEAKETLSASEYQILWLLVRGKGNIISESDIIQFLHEDDPDDRDLPMGNSSAVLITRLRDKLQNVCGDRVTVETVRGLGYALELKAGTHQG